MHHLLLVWDTTDTRLTHACECAWAPLLGIQPGRGCSVRGAAARRTVPAPLPEQPLCPHLPHALPGVDHT